MIFYIFTYKFSLDCFRPKRQRKETSSTERDQEVLRNKSESLTGLLTEFINKCKLVAVMMKVSAVERRFAFHHCGWDLQSCCSTSRSIKLMVHFGCFCYKKMMTMVNGLLAQFTPMIWKVILPTHNHINLLLSIFENLVFYCDTMTCSW